MPPSPYLIWIKIYSHDLNLAVYSVYNLPQVPRLFSQGSSVPYYCTFKNAFQNIFLIGNYLLLKFGIGDPHYDGHKTLFSECVNMISNENMWPMANQDNLSSTLSIFPMISHFTSKPHCTGKPNYCTLSLHIKTLLLHTLHSRLLYY